MDKYQIKVRPQNTYLYGSEGIKRVGGAAALVLIVRNDEVGEPIQISVVKKPEGASNAEVLDFGILEAAGVLAITLKDTLKVLASSTVANADSEVFCTVMASGA